MKAEESQAKSIQQGFQEAIDFADGKPVNAVVHNPQSERDVRAESCTLCWMVLSIFATGFQFAVMAACVMKWGYNIPSIVGLSIGFIVCIAYYLTFYAGERSGIDRSKEMAYSEAANTLKKMIIDLQNEITAKESAS